MRKILCAILSLTLCALPFFATSEAVPDIQIAAHIETETKGDSFIQYAQASGLADEVVQESLNALLKWFSIGAELDDDPEYAYETVEGVTQFAIINDRYISVRTDYFYNGASLAHPWSRLATLVFDLETGEPAGAVNDFILVDEDLRIAITDGTFTVTHPDAEFDGMMEVFAGDFVDQFDPELFNTSFYLTDTSFGLLLGDRIHAEGDYWTIEATYESVWNLLTPKLTETLQR
ncbi:MAG: hypothetical protein LBS72_08335 [Oscillospiraceae bacterium]|jgi:hypothetical protein|nr:hypothetical protein [Oscillospiraceae bacterium]